MQQIYRQIAAAGRKCGADRVVLFGSRARGDHRQGSDIDIAVWGMPQECQPAFWSHLDDLPTLLKIDIVHVTQQTDTALLRNIERDGVILMDKMQEKYTKLISAVDRLKEALKDYENNPLASIRDGAIQRFEFCTELTWKTLREYLIDQGYTDVNSPKSAIRQAFADGVIQDEARWIGLLNDRNSTSHIYDEDTAATIFDRIKNQYVDLFDDVVSKLGGTK